MMQSVQVIIERLKSHPEEFFGDVNEHKSMTIKQPKFYDVISKLDNLLTENQDGQVHRLWYLEPEERKRCLLRTNKLDVNGSKPRCFIRC
jgi:hypothetical protein